MGKEANNEKIVDRLLETENLTGQLPHKRITVGSLLTKQVSLTERCTQDGNTNLSMLDNSNSELSDLSLYSRLKNAAMCLQKTHKTIHKDPRLNKSKSLNSRKPKTALKDNDFPLISPFFLNKNSYESKIVKLDSDPAVTKFLSTFSAPFKYQCHTPKAMKPNSSHVQTTKRPYHSCVTKTRKPKPPKNWFQSHQACSACLGRGKLLGCSTCPRVFHFNCVEEVEV
ncbi:hypothetical protein BC833DRAFT_626821 [Globomyces pollinis-pini]|nr:hypothetical protein BC833DRAFT_626821 [Globomyces pollinis-pini]